MKICVLLVNFYPRPPRGGRHRHQIGRRRSRYISIHALREEGDAVFAGYSHYVSISIHALREEGDLSKKTIQKLYDISIHALREEGD